MPQPTPLSTSGPQGGLINPPAVNFEGQVRVGGKGARCQVGNPLTTLFVKDATIDPKADDEDTSNFESQGYDSGTTGLWGCGIDCSGDWDSGLARYGNPPGIYPRDDLQQKYFINVTDNFFFLFPYSRVLTTTVAIPTRTLISFKFSGKSNGPMSLPDLPGD